MKYLVQNHEPSLSITLGGDQPWHVIPHTADGPGVVLELPPELVDKLQRSGNHPGINFARVADHHEPHELERPSGVRVIVRERLDWPQGFELKAGVTDVASLDAWVAGIPLAVRPKLAPFVRSDHVQVLDLDANPHADVSAAAADLLEAV